MRKPADIALFMLALLRRPGALAAAAFMATGAALATNALYLQPRMHPSPLFSTRVRAPTAVEDPELVHAVQVALALSGRYTGSLDGVLGAQTIAAIQAFEKATGRSETGRASVELLTAIRTSAVPTRIPKAAPSSPPTPSQKVAGTPVEVAEKVVTPDPVVADVQKALALAAYGPLTADGVAGPDTHAAIMRFQKDHNLPVTGEITDALVVELRAVGAIHDG